MFYFKKLSAIKVKHEQKCPSSEKLKRNLPIEESSLPKQKNSLLTKIKLLYFKDYISLNHLSPSKFKLFNFKYTLHG